MHSEILTAAQTEISPFLAKYRTKYFMPGFETDEKTVRNFLTDAALSEF